MIWALTELMLHQDPMEPLFAQGRKHGFKL